MSKLAIIPARGGSKRIPRKNIKLFLGKPIISYSIEAAIASGLFDEVMVSTDDEEIAEIARSHGAKVPFMRSNKNADDFATTSDVIHEVLQHYKIIGNSFEFVCCIYPTAPLISTANLKKAFNILEAKGYMSVFPAINFSYPIWRSLKMEPDGRVLMNWPEYEKTRSQDLPTAYHDAGQFYWLCVDNFMKEQKLFGANSGVLLLSEIEVQDIDNIEDWILAELKMQIRNKGDVSDLEISNKQ
ncbi:MAG: pseudaminic acid cytidylyltransferase [Phaeodactylibacter sp.]|uniref:pseudaminic acid cytidylyltransferase n=1 Tax=Phaeodactylibacter sp. TaxID=1940289 RepID=UPI0032EFC4F9